MNGGERPRRRIGKGNTRIEGVPSPYTPRRWSPASSTAALDSRGLPRERKRTRRVRDKERASESAAQWATSARTDSSTEPNSIIKGRSEHASGSPRRTGRRERHPSCIHHPTIRNPSDFRPATCSVRRFRSGSDLGAGAKVLMDAGRLVPDEIIVDLVEERIFGRRLCQRIPARRLSAHDSAGDGNARPRCCASTPWWKITVPDEHIIERMSGRRVHPSSGRNVPRTVQPARGRWTRRRDRRASGAARR